MLLALLYEILVIDGLLLVVKDLSIGKTDEEELLWDQLVTVRAEFDTRLLVLVGFGNGNLTMLKRSVMNELHITPPLNYFKLFKFNYKSKY